MSLSKMGHSASQETREKMSEAAKRRGISAETREKMGLARRGRKVSPETRKKLSGENSSSAKLTLEQVREIREKCIKEAFYRGLQAKLAREYGVSKTIICDIVHNRVWKFSLTDTI
jgi:hypothetical protein